MISDRANEIQESVTLKVTAIAKGMIKEGIDVANFAGGEPDFPPPKNVSAAAVEAINKGMSKYTPATGTPELKAAICKKLETENGISYKPENIIVSCGAKHSIYNIMQAVVNPGDEVIIPAPYWVSYPDMAILAGGKPVIVETDDSFHLSSKAVTDAITDKTKIIILNSPSNPSGAVIPKKVLEEIADIAVNKGIYVISDEIYEHIVYDVKHDSIASLNDKIKELTFTVNGFSKSYAIPGWRLGYTAGPVNAIKAMGKIQSQSTSNPTSIVQYAGIEALLGPQEILETMRAEYEERRDYIVDALNSIKGVSCNKPEGAFYVFPKIPSDDSLAFSEELLKKGNVAVVPGVGFGKEGYVRLSYATSMEVIKKGIERIKKFIEG